MQMNRGPIAAPGTAMARVYAHVRDRILSGVHAAGDRLGEAAIAAELGVSRTPVREALRNLAADGFVDLKPHAGAMVRPWDFREILSSFEIRADIEGLACAHAATRITEGELAEISGICDRIEASGADRAPPGGISRSSVNREFHVRILQISGLAHAEKMAMQLMDLAVLTMTFNHYGAEDARRSNSDHRMILRAFRRGDEALARSAMRTHILTAACVLEEQRAARRG